MALVDTLVTVGVNFSTSGNQTIVAAVAGVQLFLRGLALIVNGATTLTFNSQDSAGTNPNPVSFGPFVFPSASAVVLDDVLDSSIPWAKFTSGSGLVINSSNAVQVSGFLRYSLIARA